jgi:methionyl-tRNA formyltransferase
VRLVFAGTPEVAVPSLRALLAAERHEVLAVVTRPDAPAGRGRRPTRSPVGVLADQAGLEVLTPRRPSDPDFLVRLSALAPDCCPVVAYGALVPRSALDIPKYGWVNLHFSLLPAWRGAAPVPAGVR